MKSKIINYSFNKDTKTITSDEFIGLSLENILLVREIKTGLEITSFISLVDNILTLNYDTSFLNNNPKFLIYVEDNNNFSFNDDSRLRVSTKPGMYDLIEGDITANGQSISFYVDDISNIVIHNNPITTVVGHNVAFEASLNSTNGTDGVWFGIQGARTNANTVATSTGTLTTNPGYGFEFSVNAYKWVRLRATAHTSGTMRWYIQPGSYATEPVPINQVTSVTAGSRGAGNWYTETTTNLANGSTFTSSNRAIGSSTILYWSKMRYRIYSSHSGTFTVESSRDTTNFRSLPEYTDIVIQAGVVTMIEVPVFAYYTRCKFTNTGGATTTTLEILSNMIM